MIWGGAEVVLLVLGSSCKYRLSLAERFDCTETIINQSLANSYQNAISEWQVKTSSGLPLILHYGELYNYFIICYNVIIIEIKCTINVMHLNHPETIPLRPGPWKNCLPWNRSLVPKRLGTAALKDRTILDKDQAKAYVPQRLFSQKRGEKVCFRQQKKFQDLKIRVISG